MRFTPKLRAIHKALDDLMPEHEAVRRELNEGHLEEAVEMQHEYMEKLRREIDRNTAVLQ